MLNQVKLISKINDRAYWNVMDSVLLRFLVGDVIERKRPLQPLDVCKMTSGSTMD